MRTKVAVLAVLVAITVGAWAYACEVQAGTPSYFKDEYNVVQIVFPIDARCGRGQGCGGTIKFMIVVSSDGKTRSLGEQMASWQTSQSGSASAQARVPLLRGEEVVSVSVLSVTCQ